MVAVEVLNNLVNCWLKMLYLRKLEGSVLSVDPTGSWLQESTAWAQCWVNKCLKDLLNNFLHVLLSGPGKFLIKVSKCEQESFCALILTLGLLQVLTNSLEIVCKVHRLRVLTFLSELKWAQGLYKLGELLLNIQLIFAVNLKSDVLNWVLSESHDVPLSRHEQWKRNFEKNLLNVRLDHYSCVLQAQSLCQKLDWESQCSGSNKLSFSF